MSRRAPDASTEPELGKCTRPWSAVVICYLASVAVMPPTTAGGRVLLKVTGRKKTKGALRQAAGPWWDLGMLWPGEAEAVWLMRGGK